MVSVEEGGSWGLLGEKLILVAVKQIWLVIRLFPLRNKLAACSQYLTSWEHFNSSSNDRGSDTWTEPSGEGGPYNTYDLQPGRSVRHISRNVSELRQPLHPPPATSHHRHTGGTVGEVQDLYFNPLEFWEISPAASRKIGHAWDSANGSILIWDLFSGSILSPRSSECIFTRSAAPV